MFIANLFLPGTQFNQKLASALCTAALISNLHAVCKITLNTVNHYCFLKFGIPRENV